MTERDVIPPYVYMITSSGMVLVRSTALPSHSSAVRA